MLGSSSSSSSHSDPYDDDYHDTCPDVVIDEPRESPRKLSLDRPRLGNPWLDKPHPISCDQPSIRSMRRHFEDSSVNSKMKAEGLTWPFGLDPHNESHIHYYDHRGYGNPPDDIGFTGDVYLDMGSYPKHVWIREGTAAEWRNSKWVLWGPTSAKDSSLPLAEHPLLKERWLWFRPSGGICWYGKKHLLVSKVPPHERHNPSPFIDEMLENEGRAASLKAQDSPLTMRSITVPKRLRIESPPTLTAAAVDSDDLAQMRNTYYSQQEAANKFISTLEATVESERTERSSLKRKYDEIKEENSTLKQENATLHRQLREALEAKDDLVQSEQKFVSERDKLLTVARTFIETIQVQPTKDHTANQASN